MDWFLGIFTSLLSDDFVERHHCGSWHPVWVGVYVIANAMTFVVYFLMARGLHEAAAYLKACWADKPGRLVLHLTDEERGTLFGSASRFLLWCGLLHAEGVLAFWHATYHIYALGHAVVAVVSWRALVVFVSDARRITPLKNDPSDG